MRNTSEAFIGAIIRQVIFGLVVVAVALVGLRALHDLASRTFPIGPPPASAMILMGGAVLATFIGAAIIGVLCGSAGGRSRAPGALLAALFTFGWSLAVCAVVVPFYASNVVESVATDAAGQALRERGALYGRAANAISGVREGRASDVARNTASEAIEGGKNTLLRNAARIPALSVLLWTLIGPPLGAAFEASRARRR